MTSDQPTTPDNAALVEDMGDTQELIERLRATRWISEVTGRKAANTIASLQRRNEKLRETLVKISSGIKTDLPNRGEYERGWNAARFRMEGIAHQALEDTDSGN